MLINCTNAEYHLRPELSSSQLAAFILDPIDFYHTHKVQDWPRPEPSPSMQFGTQVHEMIELGQPPHIVRIPDSVLTSNGQKRGKAFDAWKADQPPGATLLKSSEIDWREPLWQHLILNPYTKRWITCPRKELTVIWTHKATGQPCRCKYDLIDDAAGIIVDWKTTTDVGGKAFNNSIYKFLYHIRAAFYLEGWRTAFNEELRFVAVAIKNQRSWQVQPYELGEDWLALGHRDMELAMTELTTFDLETYLCNQVGQLKRPDWAVSVYEEG